MSYYSAASCDDLRGRGDYTLFPYSFYPDNRIEPVGTLSPSTPPPSPQSGSSILLRRNSFDTDDGYDSPGSSLSCVTWAFRPVPPAHGYRTETLNEDPYGTTWLCGRRYPEIDTYICPVDLLEIDRHFRQSIATKNYLGKLIHGPVKDPKVILDIGTGAGYWAMEFADTFPNASVYGIDQVCMQSEWVPPNCSFICDDLAQSDWHQARFCQNADLVRVDKIFGDIPFLMSVLKSAYDCCAPGCVVEINDFALRLGNYNEQTPCHQFYRDLKEAYRRDNRVLDLANAYQQILEGIGYQQVTRVIREIPLGAPRDLKQEEVYQAWLAGLETISLRLFCKHLDKSPEQALLDIALARKSLQQGGIKGNLVIEIVYGVKPTMESPINVAVHGLLHTAAAAGQTLTVQELLSHGHDVNARNEYGQTPLHLAAKHGYQEVAMVLLDKNIDLNAVDHEGWTALHWAARENRLELVQVLLADGRIQPRIGRETPLTVAMNLGHLKIAIMIFNIELRLGLREN
ncbi:uncharacterized protein BDV17DRAFT_265659 [Aspergillus undulatus]|uniref:uncharacterized protein n=1 Tax=Aspergillus undulatus TaxID=1810928 RepID=UPI003CCD8533